MRYSILFALVVHNSTALAAPPLTGTENSGQPTASSAATWPSPVADTEVNSLLVVDVLEYKPQAGGALRWDVFGWRGGDYRRLWIKSEGTQDITASNTGIADLQVLFGQLISPFFDLQMGVDYNRSWGRTDQAERWQLALGLQGIAAYSFDVEPVVFISQHGEVSGRFTASQDFLISQRLITQLRFETNAAGKAARAYDVGAGLNDVSLGLRLRYEVRREFAPYLGIFLSQLFGGTADEARMRKESTRDVSLVGGVRAWL